MKKKTIKQLHEKFEKIVRIEVESNTEFWLGRELQTVLSYARWENFIKVIKKAKAACVNAGHATQDHFLDITKMVSVGSGANREIKDVMLTRYACYLIAQNGDPQKEVVAFAQTYFAVQTRKQEIIEQRLVEIERIGARKKLTQSEKELSDIIFEKLGKGPSFAIIRSQGDSALFGGHSTKDMKNRLGVPKNRPLADFLPTITIKAKDFANEITNFKIKQEEIEKEHEISRQHIQNSEDVRKLLLDRDIKPEDLPPDEDIKKVERRVTSEKKKIIQGTNRF